MYTQVVAIGYQVPTVFAGPSLLCGWPPGAAPPVGALHITFPNWPPLSNTDMRNRFERLVYVLSEAYNHYQNYTPLGVQQRNTRGHQVLKVFTVPEFYFRPPPPNPVMYGSYNVNEFNELIYAMEVLFRCPELEDWLCVFGTVLVTDEGAVKAGLNPFIYNYCIMGMGGAQPWMRLIFKQNTSNIDGVSPGHEPDELCARAIRLSATLRDRVVEHLGIGVEICLDHAQNVLGRTVRSWDYLWGMISGITLKMHILVAGGMPINDNNVAAANNKYVFRNDGMCYPGQDPEVELKQINRPLFGPATTTALPIQSIIPVPGPGCIASPDPSVHPPQQVIFFAPQPF